MMLELSVKEMEPYVRDVVYVPLSPKGINAIVGRPIFSTDCRMFYVLSGSGSLFIEREEYPLSVGTIVLFQSGTRYRWEVFDLTVIAINFDYTRRISDQVQIQPPVLAEKFNPEMRLEQVFFKDEHRLNRPLVLQNAQGFESTFRLLSAEFYNNGSYRSDVLSAYLKATILHLTETVREKNGPMGLNFPSDLVKNIVYFIQSHYKEEISNDRLCKKYGCSVTYLNRIFKEHSLGTLHQFLTTYRMGIALELLHTTDLPVNDVARETGFADVSYFCRLFKKKFHCTPLSYRSRQK